MRALLKPLIATGLLLMPAAAQADWVSIISRNRSTSVLLKIEDGTGKPGFGSGTIIDAYGHVLTARHLLGTPEARSREAFEISGLVGWSKPSIDFSKATDLVIDYISQKHDLAILHFQSPHPPVQAVAPRLADIPDGTQIVVMGYPGGGNLTSTSGIAAGAAGPGKIKTDARVEKGDSGCGVFDDSGHFVGMLIEGSKSSSEDGSIQWGYFLTATTIASDIATTHPPFTFQSGNVVAEVPVRPSMLNLSYRLDETKSDHTGLGRTKQTYQRKYSAQPGYKILSANFYESNANHVIDGPRVAIDAGGESATVEFGLESGPIYDQWRGWLSGTVLLTEGAR